MLLLIGLLFFRSGEVDSLHHGCSSCEITLLMLSSPDPASPSDGRVRMAALRTWLGVRTIALRFQEVDSSCVCGCHQKPDSMGHYLMQSMAFQPSWALAFGEMRP